MGFGEAEFERRLDPNRFLRVHRSHIVNLDFVTALVPFDATRFRVEPQNGTKIVASRAASRELRPLAV
jgi:two-component system LytT family response regulator